MKELILIHGIKGGIGKSMFASVLVDYSLQKNVSVAIVEADGAVPDVSRRFAGIVQSMQAPISEVESIYSMLENLENSDDDIERVIVNLPANSELLDAHADELSEVLSALEYEVKTVFMIAEAEDSPTLALASMKSGLCSISSVAVAVVNQKFGTAEDRYPWLASRERDQWLEAGGLEAALWCLNKRVLNENCLARGGFYELTQYGSKLTTVNRMLLHKWLVKSGYEICKLLDKGA